LQLWDTAGQEVFRSIIKGYYRNSAAAMFIFDLSRLETLESIDAWLKEVKSVSGSDIITYVIGNKSDLVLSGKVSYEDAEKFAKEHSMKYFEVSSKTGENVELTINSLFEDIEKKINEGLITNSNFDQNMFTPNNKAEKKSCC
jgi:small GTP-binding protein